MNSLKKYYEKKSVSYNIKDKRLKNILELTLPVKKKIVLDVGCTAGYLGSILQKKGAKVYGVDISQKAIQLARKKIFSAQQLDLNEQKLPFKNNLFDLIIASEVIEHLFQPANFLKDAHRVLKNNGKLILSTPNFLYWGNRINFIKGTFGYTQEGMFDEGHIHFYTYSTLNDDLARSGFLILAENNVFASEVLKTIKAKFPAVFSYQFIFQCKKKV